MASVGEVVFDRSSDNHDEIWDDTELVRAYDRAHRQIQNRLRTKSKQKRDLSTHEDNTTSQTSNRQKIKKDEPIQPSTLNAPIPLPINMIDPPKNEDDAFHSMLMAWYMAGYHAGQLAAKNWKPSS